MLRKLIILSVGFMVLAACHPVHPAHPHGCPPGQAKKGNCAPWVK